MKVRAIVLISMGCVGSFANAMVVYSTGFESSEGYLAIPGTSGYHAYYGDSTSDLLGDDWTVLPSGQHTGIDLVKGWVTPAPDGQWIDLIGTTGPGGIERTVSMLAGYTYTLTWRDYSNIGGAASTNVGNAYNVVFGNVGYATTSLIQASRQWVQRTVTYTAATTGDAKLRFYSADGGYGNTGIDSVKIEAVPEPFTMGIGVIGLGLAVLRRRTKRTA
jgi:hypothetical protein